MKFKFFILTAAICLSGEAFAGPDVPGKFMQDGTAASAVVSAISMVQPYCVVPLDFQETDRAYPQDPDDTEPKGDAFLAVTCDETEDGTTGGVGIAFSSSEGRLFPEYFYSFP